MTAPKHWPSSANIFRLPLEVPNDVCPQNYTPPSIRQYLVGKLHGNRRLWREELG
jgi:hypothetical protein